MGRSGKSDDSGHGRFALRERPRVEWLRLGAVAGLSAAIVAQAAEVSLHLWTLTRSTADLPRPAAMPRQLAPRVAVQDLVAAHLFGKIPDSPQDAGPAGPGHWVLTGTLQGETPASGAAILGRTATMTRFCAVGQEISGGFRLIEVFSDHVIIEGAGVRMRLRLPRAVPGRSANPEVRLASATQETAHEPESQQPSESEQPHYPAALVELQPALERPWGRRSKKNMFEGMRVWGTGDGRNLSAYGLQRNDVIRAVDGQPVNSSEAQQRALETLSQGKPVPVTVERNGTVFTLQMAVSEDGS